jgi:hypothetical protein
LTIIRNTFTEGFDNQRHSAFEIAQISALMIGVPLDRLLGDNLEFDPFVFHVRRHFHATQNVGLTHCI